MLSHPLRLATLVLSLTAADLTAVEQPAAPQAVTVDDLMALRSIVDVKIAPDGTRVAYAVSTPSVPRNRHETALFVVPASGGAATRVAESMAAVATRGGMGAA